MQLSLKMALQCDTVLSMKWVVHMGIYLYEKSQKLKWAEHDACFGVWHILAAALPYKECRKLQTSLVLLPKNYSLEELCPEMHHPLSPTLQSAQLSKREFFIESKTDS